MAKDKALWKQEDMRVTFLGKESIVVRKGLWMWLHEEIGRSFSFYKGRGREEEGDKGG